MKVTGKCKVIVIAVGLWAMGSLLPALCQAYTGTVVQVDRGDLLTVSVNGSLRKIRLYGVACPRFGQPSHKKALFMTKFLSLQKSVEITPVFTDNDGIENALVRLQGSPQYLNSELVGYGLAWVKPCSSKSRLCREWKKQEGFAQSKSIGLWAELPAIAPWEWEKAKRQQILERMNAEKKQK